MPYRVEGSRRRHHTLTIVRKGKDPASSHQAPGKVFHQPLAPHSPLHWTLCCHPSERCPPMLLTCPFSVHSITRGMSHPTATQESNRYVLKQSGWTMLSPYPCPPTGKETHT